MISPRFSTKKLPIILFQSFSGFLSGVALFVLFETIPDFFQSFQERSTKDRVILIFSFLLMAGAILNFAINGNIRGLSDRERIAKLYSGPPSDSRVRWARIMFWFWAAFAFFVVE